MKNGQLLRDLAHGYWICHDFFRENLSNVLLMKPPVLDVPPDSPDRPTLFTTVRKQLEVMRNITSDSVNTVSNITILTLHYQFHSTYFFPLVLYPMRQLFYPRVFRSLHLRLFYIFPCSCGRFWPWWLICQEIQYTSLLSYLRSLLTIPNSIVRSLRRLIRG